MLQQDRVGDRANAAGHGRDGLGHFAGTREVDVADEYRAVFRQQPRFFLVVRDEAGVGRA